MRPGPLLVVGIGFLWFVLSGRAAAVVNVIGTADSINQGSAPTPTASSGPAPGPVAPPTPPTWNTN